MPASQCYFSSLQLLSRESKWQIYAKLQFRFCLPRSKAFIQGSSSLLHDGMVKRRNASHLKKAKEKKITAVPSSWDIFNQSWRLTEMSMKKRFFSFPLWLCCHLCSRQGSGLNLSTKLTARGRMGCRWLCGGSPSNGDNLFRLSVFIQDNLFRLSATS